MQIEWEKRTNYDGSTDAVLAKIVVPSNIRRGGGILTAGAISKLENDKYKTSFIRAIHTHLQPPRTQLNTEKGARRRVQKYLTLWAIAGYPIGD